MAVQLTPLGKIVLGTLKWVAIPLILGLIGYRFIGPNIRGTTPPPAPEHKNPALPAISDHGKKFESIRGITP